MTKMKRNDNPWNEASSRVIITDVPEQAARRRRSRRGVNFLAKMKTKLHEIISKKQNKTISDWTTESTIITTQLRTV